MAMINKINILHNFLALILATVFLTVLIESEELVNGIWTAKTFYFYTVSVIVFAVGFVWLVFRKKNLITSFNLIDLFLLTYYFYNVVRLIFTENIPFYNARIITFTFLKIFYFIFKNYFNNFNLNKFTPAYILIIAFLTAGFWQASIGLFQSHNLFGYYSGYFKALGSFGNPAPYTGYIISVLPFSFGLYLLLDNKNIVSTIIKYLGLITFSAAIFVLPATKTRGGWLAALAGIITVLFYKYDVSIRLKTIFNNRLKKLLASFSIISIVVLLFIGLYQIRPSSAFGRLLIWKVSTNIIVENPIFGIGYDRFGQVYNRFQGNYFAEQDRDGFEKYVAGNVKQAHNEYIEQTAELGIIGIFLFVGLLATAVFKTIYSTHKTVLIPKLKNQNYQLVVSAKASIIALIVSACFSYPFQILPTLLNFIFLLSIVSSIGNYRIISAYRVKKSQQWVLIIAVLPLLLFFSITEIENFDNQKKWNEAVTLSHFQSYDRAINIYKNLYPKLNNQGNFLVNYGGVLSLNGQHKKAIEILEEGKNINCDPNLYILLGNSYKEVGKIEKAINEYKNASNIIPHKFYPKYLIAKLYNKNGENEKAKMFAMEIINMEEKIPSTATREIKNEMKELINYNLSDEAKQLNINQL